MGLARSKQSNMVACLDFGCNQEKFDMDSHFTPHTSPTTLEQLELQRRDMVKLQLDSRGIKDREVLAAMSKVPRHCFVNPEDLDLAYRDRPLTIGYDQTISQPYIVAYMTQAAEINSQDRVLEIGTGCGYQTAILGEIARQVYSIEIQPQLAATARETIDQFGYQNIEIKTGNGYQGWAEHAPYDAIVVTAAPAEVPPTLVEQLAVGGTMVIPVGARHQNIIVLTKTENEAIAKKTIPVRFVPMREKLS